MKIFFNYLLSVLFLTVIENIAANHGINDEHFVEQLLIRSLNNGQLSTHFEFKTFVNVNLSHPFDVNAGQHNDIFPLSLLRLFHQLEIQELHFSLTKGYWKNDKWGLPIRSVSTNAHLSAWFLTYSNSENNWKKLTSLLSGQFCASINLINPTVTIRPKLSYHPLLKLKSSEDENNEHVYGYVATLPQEAICTENLTPFIKMLPCQRNKGLASLLHATNIFDTQFFSQSIDFEFTCSDINHCQSTTGIELKQNIVIVFDAPLLLDGKYSWTLNRLFGSSLTSHCPLAESSLVYVDATPLNRNLSSNGKLFIEPTEFIGIDFDNENKICFEQLKSKSRISEREHTRLYAEYDLKTIINNSNKSKNGLNIGIQYPKPYNGILNYPTGFNSLQVRRFPRGIGVQTGGITVLLINRFPFKVDATYTDTIPWYLRMYLHTMTIETQSIQPSTTTKLDLNKQRIEPKNLYYQPARDRVRPHQIELQLELQPNSITEIRFEFDHQFLRWTEFPPDPNHGLYINPATITFTIPENNHYYFYEKYLLQLFNHYHRNDSQITMDQALKNLQNYYSIRLYTEPLIIMMPTPDFSMPYNVICLVSTVLSIAFGPIYNLTTRKVINRMKCEKQEPQRSRKKFIFF